MANSMTSNLLCTTRPHLPRPIAFSKSWALAKSVTAANGGLAPVASWSMIIAHTHMSAYALYFASWAEDQLPVFEKLYPSANHTSGARAHACVTRPHSHLVV